MGIHKKLLLSTVAWCILAFSCNEEKPNTELKNPVPTPVSEAQIPKTPDVVPDPTASPSPTPEVQTTPYFSQDLPASISINEGEVWQFSLNAVDPQGGPLTYAYQCPYNCPSGIAISEEGSVEWRPEFNQSGTYDIKFVAVTQSGYTGETNQIRFTVVNVNRAPEITEILIIPNKPVSPETISCIANKNDPDGDEMITTRTWYVNDVEREDLSGITLATNNFSAHDKIKCKAAVIDIHEEPAESKISEEYIVPNTAPVITSIEVKNLNPLKSTFTVGDVIICHISAVDDDGHTIERLSTVFKRGNEILSDEGEEYTIKSTDSHKNIMCSVSISDGDIEVSASSSQISVSNSPPVITSVSLEKLIPENPLKTGDTVRCVVEFEDPDSDLSVPTITFLNGANSRGGGILESQTSQSAKKRYTLRSIQDVSNPLNADVRGHNISCMVRVTDNSGAYSEMHSDPILVVDRAPEIEVSTTQGQLTQDLATSMSLEPVKLNAIDYDGDQVFFEKVSDTCSLKGIYPSITLSGLVTTTIVPEASYPQTARDCHVSYKGVANGLETPLYTISLEIPNRPPVITCSTSGNIGTGVNPVVRYLKTGEENFQRILISPGQEIGKDTLGNITPATQIVCKATDPDGNLAGSNTPPGGEFGDAFAFILSSSVDNTNCTLGSMGSGLFPESELRITPLSTSSKSIKGAMGLESCSKTIRVLDGDPMNGGLYSDNVKIELKPTLEMVIADQDFFTNACRVSVSANPIFNDGYSYSEDSPATASFEGGIGEDIKVGKNVVEAFIPQAYLENNNSGSGLLLNWVMRGVKDLFPQITRTVSRKWTILTETNTNQFIYPQTPRPRLNKDMAEGRQVVSFDTCPREASCNGKRASITAGLEHTCTITTSGLIFCWGSNEKKQLAFSLDGVNYENQNQPQIVEGITGINDDIPTLVSAGDKHTCSLMADGKVKCWGFNNYGQLGLNSVSSDGVGVANYVQTAEGLDLDEIISVATGKAHSCALKDSGEVYCWGSNLLGQMGLPPTPWTQETCALQPCYITAKPIAGISEAVSIYAGGDVSCAVLKSGEAKCWGDGTYGQLGTGGYPSPNHYTEPYTVKNLNNILSMSLGDKNTCVLVSGGRISCFGVGNFGQLGTGLTENTNEASTTVFSYTGEVAQMSNGSDFTCALKSNGQVECFGNNQISPGIVGKLGSETSLPSATAKNTVKSNGSNLTNIIAIAAGSRHTCAINFNQQVYCWGDGASGQLGNGSNTSSNSAVIVTSFMGNAFATKQTCTQVYRLQKD